MQNSSCRLCRSAIRQQRRSLATVTAPAPGGAIQASKPNSLLSLNDLSVPQIQSVLSAAAAYKKQYKAGQLTGPASLLSATEHQVLANKTIALMFNKRSTRTRVASESSTRLLGGHPMFLSSSDIQLGVNESLQDTSIVVSSMVDGIFARVGDHLEIEVSSRGLDLAAIQ